MIDAQALKNAGIDYDAGLTRFMNDPDLYEAVLSAFLQESIWKRAQRAFDDGDWELLGKVAHEAKGAGGNAGLDNVYSTASALVSLLRGKRFSTGELGSAYHRFIESLLATTAAIKAALGK